MADQSGAATFDDHSHAALLIAQGEHPKVIQERLGHASIKTTLDTYGHLLDGLDETAAERLEVTFTEVERNPAPARSHGR